MNLKPLLILPPLALGVAGFMWMNQPKEELVQPQPESRLAVRVAPVTAEPLVVTATGYGWVEAERSWSAVSQVDGRIIEVVDDLAEGTLVGEGALLVQVDPTDYELAVQKSYANIEAAEASLAELDAQEANSQRLLEIEERILEVARAEYDRASALSERGTSTQSALDAVQKTLLAEETAVTTLQNTMALYPVQRASTEATLAVRKAELAEAERALENTTIRAPFSGRVAEATAEVGQFIRTGEQLLTLENIDTVEIVAAVQPRVFAPVLEVTLGRSLSETVEIEAANMLQMLVVAGVQATVRLQFAEFDVSYPAEIVRFSGSVDSETGTIGLAVRVALPETRDPDKHRPPLNPGSFVSVDFTSPPTDGLVAVPRAVVHQDDAGAPFVYTADAEDRLTIAPVTLGPVVNGNVIVETGLAVGDRLVLSSPRPPIEGLLLDPVPADGGA